MPDDEGGPLKLLRDGDTPDWGAPEAELSAFFRQQTGAQISAGPVTAVPTELRAEADWRSRLAVPQEVVRLDGLALWLENEDLWRSDGTRLGTYRVARLPASRFRSERIMRRLGARLFIVADVGTGDVGLFSWDGQRLRERRRWARSENGGSVSHGAMTEAGGFLWLGVSAPEGDALFRIDDEGGIDRVRNLLDPSSPSFRYGEDFAGVFELEGGLVSLEGWRASFVRNPGADQPSFEDIVVGSGFRLRSWSMSRYDQTLWFAMQRRSQTLAYRVDGTEEGTTAIEGPVRLGGISDAYRRDRWLEATPSLVLKDDLGSALASTAYGSSVYPTPSALLTEGPAAMDPNPPLSPSEGPREVYRIELEDGATQLLATSTAGVPRWRPAADGAYVLELPTERGPPQLEVLEAGSSALSAPVDLQLRRRPVEETRLIASAGTSGLLASREFDRGGIGEIEWFDRKTGARRLRAEGAFVAAVNGALLFTARGEPVGSALYRFDPERDEAPVLLRGASGTLSLLGRVDAQLMMASESNRGQSVVLYVVDVDQGTATRLSTSFAEGLFGEGLPQLDRRLVQGPDRLSFLVQGESGSQLYAWSSGDRLTEPPRLVVETELRLNPPQMIAVDDVVWATDVESRLPGPSIRRFYRLGSGPAPEAPILSLPVDSSRGFFLWPAPPGQRAFASADGALVQLTRNDAFVVEGLPAEIRSVTVTETGAYVVADDLVHGPEAYRIYDRPERSPELLEVARGPAGSYPTSFTAAFGGHVFLADDGIHGRELWFDDGQDTRLVCDFRPGLLSGAQPRGLVVDETGVYLRVETGWRGQAIWRVGRSVVLGQTPCPRPDELSLPPTPAPPGAGGGAEQEELQSASGGCRDAGGEGVALLWVLIVVAIVRRPRDLTRSRGLLKNGFAWLSRQAFRGTLRRRGR